MKQYQKLYKDQKGSTLLLVLICMTLIGLLGSAILTATVSNMKMKTVDALSKDNFYTAEAAVDELRVGLEETAQLKMKEAYAYMLQRYSITPDSERNQVVMKKFLSLFYNSLAVDASNGFVDATSFVDATRLKQAYLSHSSTRILNTTGSAIGIHKDMTDLSVTLTNVMLAYTDDSGYETKITTDLRITPNYPTLTSRAFNNRGIYYADYALIADDIISKEGSNASNVAGNVYGGLGIIVDGNETTKLKLASNDIITRESIEVRNKGQLEVPGIYKDNEPQNAIWARNLVTNSTMTTMNNSDYMVLDANCYIADDLTMNAISGDIKIDGTYYGYHTKRTQAGTSNGAASFSSSIAINAKNANLDLSNLDLLWLAGRTYLSVPVVDGNSERVSEIMQGQSIALKADQIAYMVPGNCIVGIGHNPMTVEEFSKISNEGAYHIDVTKSSENGSVDLTKYVDLVTPYQAKYVKYVNAESTMTMVYLYLNFASDKKANDYFLDYYNKNTDVLIKLIKDMTFGSVLLPTKDLFDTKVVNSGTVFSYVPSDETLSLLSRNYRWGMDNDLLDVELERKESMLERNFNSLVSYLDEDHLSIDISLSLVDNLIRFDLIKADADALVGTLDIIAEGLNDITARECILISDSTNTIVIEGANKKGLIVTRGNVVIKQGTFTGLIITKGKVILDLDGHVNADEDYIKGLVEARDDINKYFKDYVDQATVKDHEDKVIEITYENWYRE